jgi:DNA-binding response OmpR family regulator
MVFASAQEGERGGEMGEKILLIDDDAGLLTLLELGLMRAGFTVLTASSGKEGLRRAYETNPDLILLDIMMPGMDGWSTCQQLRFFCDVPIIMLTARAGQADLLKGLSLGADDYLTKPVSFDELQARIHTVLRRAWGRPSNGRGTVYDDGYLHVDLRHGTAKRNGELIHLAPTESRLLMCLVSQKGRIGPRQELLTTVWGPEYEKEIGYLSVYIRYLRRKIEDDPSNPTYIRTRWGVGYYFEGNDRFQPGRD